MTVTYCVQNTNPKSIVTEILGCLYEKIYQQTMSVYLCALNAKSTERIMTKFCIVIDTLLLESTFRIPFTTGKSFILTGNDASQSGGSDSDEKERNDKCHNFSPVKKENESKVKICEVCRAYPCECNPSAPTTYDCRKYGHNLPCDSAVPYFETLPHIPTGIFRCTVGEILGRGANKCSYYQNPEYFSYHHMTFYDMHLVLRCYRNPSAKTGRKN